MRRLTESLCMALLAFMLLYTATRADAAQAASPNLSWSYSSGPSVYTVVPQAAIRRLSAPLDIPRAIDVDDYGRFYVLDNGREALMRFSVTGQLERQWTDMPLLRCMDKRSMSVADENTIIIGSMNDYAHLAGIATSSSSEIRLRPNPQSNLVPQDLLVAGLPGGDYYTVDNRQWIAPDSTEIGYKVQKDTGCRVQVHRADGSVKKMWYDAGYPISIDAGPDGNLYSSNMKDYRIDVYSDGEMLRSIDLAHIMPEAHKPFVLSLCVDDNGDIYFAAIDRWIVRMDGSGRFLGRWKPNARADCPTTDGPLRSLAVRHGLIYALVVHQDDSSTIQCYTPDGQCVSYFESPRLTLSLPTSIAVDDKGNCAVAQRGRGVPVYYDPAGNTLPAAAKLDGAFHNSSRKVSVTARPPEGFYVTTGYGLYAVDTAGKKQRAFFSIEQFDDEAQPSNRSAANVAVERSTGKVMVQAQICDGKHYQEFDILSADGDMLFSLIPNDAHIGFTWGDNMCCDDSGKVYCADGYSHRVYKYNQTCQSLQQFGEKGSEIGQLLNPRCVVVDKAGNVIVADTGNSRIQVFSADGAALGVWGHRGRGDGELDRPMGLTIGPGSVLWISDTFNDRIVKLPVGGLLANLTKTVTPPEEIPVMPRAAAPQPGDVTVTGVIVAGSDDLSDCVYVESPDRAWAMRVVMPAGVSAKRGEKWEISGALDLRERSTRHLKASSCKRVTVEKIGVEPVGAANLYVGDGYWAGKRVGLSNLAMLMRTWGKVTAVDRSAGLFIIDDGSGPGDGAGLVILARDMKKNLSKWPEEGDYVSVTGVSAVFKPDNGNYVSALRLRGNDEIVTLKKKAD